MILAQCEGMSSWVRGCDICIPGKIGSLISIVYNAILIAIPVILVISGMFSLASSIMKQKEEDIKKAQQLLVKKLITGAIVFLLFALVRGLVSYFDNSLTKCFNALINYNESEHKCTNANCGGGSSNMDYIKANNDCLSAKAHGAVRHPDTKAFVCYLKDYENCSCPKGGDPFKYQDNKYSNSNGCNCWCAVQNWDSANGQYVFSATIGECRN